MKESPDDLRDLDRLLKSVQFEPRASLGAEVVGRWHRGERVGAAAARSYSRITAFAGVLVLLGLGLFIFWLLVLRPLGVYTVDRCCQDLDGGGDADDGLVVVSRRGEAVHRLAVYEDLDGSGSFTPGDIVRFQRSGRMALAGPIEAGVRTTEFCCLDYDGGGPSDDALVILGVPPDRITMAAIYERRGPPGAPIELR
jgi:hypothetical protein